MQRTRSSHSYLSIHFRLENAPYAHMLKYLLIVFAAYTVVLVIVYLAQSRMLYLPNAAGTPLDVTPADAGLDYDDVRLTTDDGVELHGWFVHGASDRVLLFFHGNAGDITHRLFSIQQFHDLGLSVFIIDYRGYGESGGSPAEHGLYRDAEAAWRHLTGPRGVAANDIVIFGRSLGASVASRLAATHRPGALIVESSFTSVPDIAQELYPWLPARWLTRMRHSTRDHVADVRCPVLVVHSRDDEIIPYHHGEAIFAAANEPKSLLTIRGGHNDAISVDEATYVNGIEAFLSGTGTLQ